MNTTMAPEQLIHQLNWRYATKQFDPKRKIPDRDWAALEQALLLTPSSCGLQPWAFIEVKDPAVRAKLQAVSWGQSQIVDASHLVVLAYKSNLGEGDLDAHIKRIAEVRGVEVKELAGFRAMMAGLLIQGLDGAGRAAWARNQVYIALGNLLTAAAVLGIDACPMEGIDRAQYDAILDLSKKGLATAMVATLGYRSDADKYGGLPKGRFSKKDVFSEI